MLPFNIILEISSFSCETANTKHSNNKEVKLRQVPQDYLLLFKMACDRKDSAIRIRKDSNTFSVVPYTNSTIFFVVFEILKQRQTGDETLFHVTV